MATEVEIQLGPQQANLLNIVQHDDWKTRVLTCLDQDGNAIDLTGATLTADIAANGTTYPLSVQVVDAAAGQVRVSQTAAPLIGSGAWAMRVNNETVFRGIVTGVADILP